jgi:ferredoxin-type protein NapG
MPDNDEEKPLNRRSFFRDGLFEMLKPLSKPIQRKIAPFERLAEQFSQFEETGSLTPPRPATPYYAPQPPHISLPVLRPPGALAEQKFLDTCTRCGHSVSVCPASAIRIDETAYNGNGAPYVDAEIQPCVVCDGLFCMKECPSEALGYLPRWLIDMGTAEWKPDSCLRNHGDTCTACIDQCPLGSSAIELRGNDVHVKVEGCTGCGVCQYYCPTYPKSIVVIPKSQKLADAAAQ